MLQVSGANVPEFESTRTPSLCKALCNDISNGCGMEVTSAGSFSANGCAIRARQQRSHLPAHILFEA